MYSVQLQMIRIKDGNEEQEDPDVDIFNISQNVQDIVIHLEVDEEQWAITQGSKRQARWVWSPRTMSVTGFGHSHTFCIHVDCVPILGGKGGAPINWS